MPTADWKDSLGKLGGTLKAMLDDASKLTVRTFRGGVKATYDPTKNEWTVEPNASGTMLAMTEISLDGDVDLFIPMDEKNNVDTALLEHHQRAVRDGAQARTALIKSIVDVLKSV